jgi:predicted acyl esterase
MNMRKKLIFLVSIIIILIANLSKSQNKNSEDYQFPLLPQRTGLSPNLYMIATNNFNLALRDGVILDCSKFYPSIHDTINTNGYPAVIMCHGFGSSKVSLDSFAFKQAAFGYCVYTFSMRGQGNSGGFSNLISLTEALDLGELVNYVRHDQLTGVDSSKILVMGGSQGGIVPYMAACNGLRVTAIISALASPEYEKSWIENGSIKSTFLFSINYPSTIVRYNDVVSRMAGWILTDTKEKWDSLTFWLPIGRDFVNNVPQNHIPIILENSWQDKFFNSSGNINTIPFLTSPKEYYFGAVVGHGGDYSIDENNWHENFYDDWFNYWLFGINTGILTRPKFQYAYTSFPIAPYGLNMWSFVHDSSATWPPSNISNLRLYFNTSGKLKTTPNTTNDYNVLNNSVATGFTLENAVNLEFTGTEFTSNFTKSELTFDSDTLSQDLKVIGTPDINIDYSSNANLCQYNFQIFEKTNTTAKFVSRINFTDRNYTANTRNNKSINGLSFAHIFKKGNKIRVVLTNLDTNPEDSILIGTFPHVLPVMVNGADNLFLSANCYIDFPYQQNRSIGVIINSGVPDNFKLYQNYPNPFNPSTTIKYSISNNDFVTLKVYDVLGREVMTLVNEFQKAGIYETQFPKNQNTGSPLASGIYFYKLVAGNKSDVKKLMLIK